MAIIYVLICSFVYIAQEKLVYFPGSEVTATPKEVGLTFDELYIETSDGEKIHTWDIPAKASSKYILFLHGNAGNIGNRLNTISLLNRLGHSIAILDYRGYGKSTGKPSEQGTYQDALAVFKYLINTRGVAAENIVIYGRSLGGGVATWLASQVNPGGLILESTFSRLIDMGKHRYPFLPTELLTRIQYDSLSHIKMVKCPVLVAHSVDDETVPYELGKQLAEGTPNLKHFVTLSGGHNETFFDAGKDYYDLLTTFIGLAK